MGRVCCCLLTVFVCSRPVGAQPPQVFVKKDVIYGSVQGAGLVADIAYPEGKGPFPVILSVHGGRWVASHRSDPGEGAIDVKQWAGFGLFAMSIDYRLVGCSPPPACYQDLQCAIRWVHAHKDKYPIDADRIFLFGMSAGGHLVSLAATLGDGPYPRTGGWEKQPNTIRGVISLSGPYDLEKLSWGTLWKPAGGDQQAARRLASPIQHVSEKTTPLLILHSDTDGSVPVQQAQEMAEALKKAKARHRLTIYPKKGHMRINEDVIKESRAFIEEIGKGPADAQQQDESTAQARTAVEQFMKAVTAQDVEATMKAVDAPFFWDGVENIRDREQLRKGFARIFARNRLLGLEYDLKDIWSYDKLPQDFFNEKDRKLLADIVEKTDRVAHVQWRPPGRDGLAVVVRIRDGKAKVAGFRD